MYVLINKRVPLYFGVLMVVAVFLWLLFFAVQSSHYVTAPEEYSVPATEMVQASELEAVWIPELPVRLIIPAINVDAEVQYVGLAPDATGVMDVPSNFTDVGWYKYGVRPGMRGSAVMAGHYNGRNTPQAVFYDLHTLRAGDEIVIMSAERIEDIFYVVKVATYEYNAPTTEVFVSDDGKVRLNLITCGGTWLSEERVFSNRTVVFAELLTDVE